MENSQLTITDMASLHGVLEAAASRGAFKASEMRQVGELYDKLTKFLELVKEQSVNADTESAEATTSQGEENA